MASQAQAAVPEGMVIVYVSVDFNKFDRSMKSVRHRRHARTNAVRVLSMPMRASLRRCP